MMNNLPEILRLTKPQLKGLSSKGLERVKKILENDKAVVISNGVTR